MTGFIFHQLLSDANTTIAALQEQLGTLNQSGTAAKETLSSQLQDSTGQLQVSPSSDSAAEQQAVQTMRSIKLQLSSLQELFHKFQHFIDTCSKYKTSVLDKALRGEKHTCLTSLPKATMDAYSTVSKLGLQSVQSLGNIMVNRFSPSCNLIMVV